MKKQRRRAPLRGALAAAAALALSACPLSSDHPLSDPAAAALDSSLLGAWKTQDTETGEWNAATFSAFDEHQLRIVVPADEKGKVETYLAFATVIDSEQFLNVRQLDVQDQSWFFMRYAIEENRLHMRIVDDALFEGMEISSSAQLLEFFRLHLSDPRLYAAEGDEAEEMVWEREDSKTGAFHTRVLAVS